MHMIEIVINLIPENYVILYIHTYTYTYFIYIHAYTYIE